MQAKHAEATTHTCKLKQITAHRNCSYNYKRGLICALHIFRAPHPMPSFLALLACTASVDNKDSCQIEQLANVTTFYFWQV